MAVSIIEKRKRVFRRLASIIRQRIVNLMNRNDLQTVRYVLLTQQDLDDIFSKP